MTTWHTEPWKVGVIRRQAKNLGFPISEIDDVTQEVILKMSSFEFDPIKSGGASERAVFTHFAIRKLKHLIRKRFVYRCHIEKKKKDNKTFHDVVVGDRKIEMADVISNLSGLQRQVCECLREGFTPSQISKKLSVSNRQVLNIVSQLKTVFKEFEK